MRSVLARCIRFWFDAKNRLFCMFIFGRSSDDDEW